MVAAAAGAQLRPGAVLVLFGDRAYIPIGIHHLVVPAVLEAGPHAKPRFRFNGPGEAFGMPFQFADRDIQHRHLHAAGDIDADRIRNDCVLGSQHAADRQAIAHVCVRHESAGHCHGQQAGFLHLHHGLVLQAFAPLAVFHRFGSRRRRSVHNGFGQLLAQRVLSEQSRVGDDRLQFLLQLVLSPPLRMNWETKSVARRVASPRGMPRRIKSLVFITNFFLLSAADHAYKLFQVPTAGDYCS